MKTSGSVFIVPCGESQSPRLVDGFGRLGSFDIPKSNFHTLKDERNFPELNMKFFALGLELKNR